LADIKEVFNALCVAKGHTLAEVEKAREIKAKKRGGFEKKIFLIETIEE
jgi:predicted house-cleaning noncanonical NTP pyrophosphatase (MazG superfamily)